jgi:ureidoglycolate lyase
MTILRHAPLTANAFATFGDVIDLAHRVPLDINQGFAQRFDDMATVDVSSEGGSTNVSLFTAKPRPHPISINLMERHPLGSQLFYPLQNMPWFIVVCADPDDTQSYRAFSATGLQGINYHRNVWHFPLLVTNEGDRFIVVDRKGPGTNLEERVLAAPLLLQ